MITKTKIISVYLLLLIAPSLLAEDELCGSCERSVLFGGDFKHVQKPGDVNLVGADDYDVFREEINGATFTVTVPDLSAGKYIAEFAFAETHLKKTGERIFDITCGDKVLVKNLDVLQASGGFGHAYMVRFTVDHSGDALVGPLTFTFTSRTNKAILNGFSLKTADNQAIASIKAIELVPAMAEWARKIPVAEGPVIYTNTSFSINQRVDDLISRMSLAEKVNQLNNAAPAIRRLGVPAHNYWNECLHGVGRAGVATVFPQAIGMAASWDDALLEQVGDAISTEARAKYNAERNSFGDTRQYFGLTFWTPNLNIFRDPRWGRGQETYGEDPFLTARMGVNLIKGLQGNDPHYLKVAACAKHFAVHSGPEPLRSFFDVSPPEWDFYDTYLPQFEAAVREAHVESVMGAYNRVYGEPACSSTLLLKDILRDRWGFQGHVVSDCGAITFIYSKHKVAPTPEAGAARAVIAGCDLCCGKDYFALVKAVDQKLISVAQIDQALKHVFTTRFRLGMFDPPSEVPFDKITISENDSPAHQALALKMARESIVLLTNDGLLPLDRSKLKRIAVIGANADSVNMLLGNYNGKASHPITILQGIRQLAGSNIEVVANRGCPLALKPGELIPDFAKAVALAKSADIVIYVGGLDSSLEREEHGVKMIGFLDGDRTGIELPAVQEKLLKALKASGRPIVVVNCSGSAIAMPWENENLPAILQAWYPGESGGQAVAEILFGVVNPSGKLPITVYRSTADLPPFEDYSMSNRTYRYFSGQPLYAFGHGLSYTTFELRDVKVDSSLTTTSGVARVSFSLVNTGLRDGEQVVQVYCHELGLRPHQPLESLCGFKRLAVPAGGIMRDSIEIPVQRLRHWDSAKSDYVVAAGEYEFRVGMAADQITSRPKIIIQSKP